MFLTRSEGQARAIRRLFASAGLGAFLTSSITSSTFESATARPSSTWPRSRAFLSSYTVRRVTTSRRCAMNHSISSFRLSRRGWLSTSATMFMWKLSCSWVMLYSLFSTTSGNLAALELDHLAHAGLVRLVAQVEMPFQALLGDQLGDLSRATPSCSPGRAARRR
jgi:hypothetical protein